MSDRLNSLLSSEEKARESVEEATREARRIRAGISAEVAGIEKEYSLELQKYEEKGISKVHDEIVTLKEKLEVVLKKKEARLDSESGKLAPKALELLRSAIEGEKV